MRAARPFAPSRVPVYYGWIIAVVAAVGTLFSVPGQTIGVSVFTDHLLEAAPGVSRVGIANAYLVGTVLSALSLPLAGRWLDRFGARPTAFVAVAVLSGTMLGLSRLEPAARALGGSAAASLALLVLGFYLIRLTGQGTLTMVCRTMVGRWFDRRRGLVAGVSAVFINFGFGYAPRVFEDWIQRGGWQRAYQQMALVEMGVMGAVVLLFFRDDPESSGLTLEGRAPPRDDGQPVVPEPASTRAEAIRTLAFWSVTAALAVQALTITAVSFHIVDLGASAGLDRASAVDFFFPLAAVSTGVGVVAGTAGDRLGPRFMILGMSLAQAVGLYGAADLDGRWALAAGGLGVAAGFFPPLSTVAFPRFFGRTHLGAITGVEMMCIVVGSALGPALFAFVRAETGSYDAALYGCLALPALVLALALVYRTPQPGG